MKKKWLGLILILILVGSIYWGLTADDELNHSTPPPGQQEEEKAPQKKASKAEVTVTSDDQTTELRLKAEKMIQPTNGSKLQLKEVEIKVFKGPDDSKQLQATLKAPEGYYWPQEGRMKFFSPVNVKNDKVKIKSDILKWNQKQNRWLGEGNVIIIHFLKEVRLTGDSFVAQVDLDKLHVKGNVRLTQQKLKAGEIDADEEK
ncbi:LPS export ABC transporter periplasmic protein LptC [Sporohalobacter salinus]|uniref:LPS export ABC transporter periplasmic protein LptC n=1 Tax=Sporohalobacter salinus TaxID=1494606 RepID=UPI001960BA33|nr:LPS export ABC transporter protein LptC [Sporohalobacter salinus]